MKTRGGYTLIEILMATGLALVVLGSVIAIFQFTNAGFANSRSGMELLGRLRSTQQLLESDISHYTVRMDPPRPVEAEDGYFSAGRISTNIAHSANNLQVNGLDVVRDETANGSIIGNFDYVAFTVFNKDAPFRYEVNSYVGETPYAEVVWFVRQNSLYRLVVPVVPTPGNSRTYFQGGTSANRTQAFTSAVTNLPSVRMVSLGLLGDLRNRSMMIGDNTFLWNSFTDPLEKCRVLSNVLDFEVEAWDPTSGVRKYRSINNLSTYYDRKTFRYRGNTGISGGTVYYDTGSVLSYHSTTAPTLGTTGNISTFPDTSTTTGRYCPPSKSFLPGIRITVRAFDPDTGQVRQFRVTQDFRRW